MLFRIPNLVVILSLLCSVNLFARQTDDPAKMVISHVNRADIDPYVEFIRQAYTELGFTVVLVPTPALRGAILVDEGVFDADVVRIDFDLVDKPNIIKIKPALNTAYVALLCIKNVPCEADVLLKSNVAIASNSVAQSQFSETELQANIVNVNNAETLPALLLGQRISYALLIIDELAEQHMSEQLNIVRLKDRSVFHVINKKHVNLVPLIEAKIAEKLPAFQASRRAQHATKTEAQ